MRGLSDGEYVFLAAMARREHLRVVDQTEYDCHLANANSLVKRGCLKFVGSEFHDNGDASTYYVISDLGRVALACHASVSVGRVLT